MARDRDGKAVCLARFAVISYLIFHHFKYFFIYFENLLQVA